MKKFSEQRIGEITVLSSAILWSLFPVLTILSYSGLGPITSLAWTTLFSFLFFIVVAFVRYSWVNIFTKDIFPHLLGITFLLGILFYVLYFFGLNHTSAGNASIIATLEIFFTFIFFNLWRREFMDVKHISGAALMFLSAVIILLPNFTSFQLGDFLVLGAVFVAPFGNLLQKQIREKISSEQILLARAVIATPVLFGVAALLGENVSRLPTGQTWLVLIINGIVLFGFTKIFWIESIHRLSVTKAISLSSISPIFTLFFAFLLLKDIPTITQVAAIPPAILGVYLLTRIPKV